jgi:putative hemolysin
MPLAPAIAKPRRLNLTLDAHFRLGRDNRLHAQLLDPKAPGWRLLELVPKLFGRWLGLKETEQIYRTLADDRREVPFFQKVVDAFDLTVSCRREAMDRIPRTGPLVVVANHPLNGIDGVALAHIVSQVRPDVKIMLTATFDGLPGIADHGIFVSDSNGPSARSRSEPTRQAIEWLRQGHVVILFPAGQGSYVKENGRRDPVDVSWMPGVSLLVRKSQAAVLPIYVHGTPGRMFQALRRFLHPAACFLLLREIVKQKSTTVRLTVGEAMSCERVLAQGEPKEQVSFLRRVTYELAA